MIFIGLILCNVIIGNNDVIIVSDVINIKSTPSIIPDNPITTNTNIIIFLNLFFFTYTTHLLSYL